MPDAPDENESTRSELSSAIENLKATTFRLAEERERLPQPLFWSLFNSKLKEIKKEKEVRRILREVF